MKTTLTQRNNRLSNKQEFLLFVTDIRLNSLAYPFEPIPRDCEPFNYVQRRKSATARFDKELNNQMQFALRYFLTTTPI